MLKSLTLKDWKSFGSERNEVQFAPLTLLVGPNASGKSNVLDALRFLQGAAFGYSISEILNGKHEGGRQVWPGIRGGFPESTRVGQSGFVVRSEWAIDKQQLHHRVMVVADQAGSKQGPVELRRGNAFRDGGIPGVWRRGDAEWSANGGPAVRLFEAEPPSAIIDDEQLQLSLKWLARVRAAVFLDIQPREMRDYRPATDRELSDSAANTAARLASLDREQLEDVAGWVDELWSKPLTLDFDRTQLDEIMLYVTDEKKRKVSARSLSDGTLRFLALVTALLTAEEGSIIVLEEPDTGMHPARIHLLAQLLEYVTTNRGIQVIATTHSPTLLAHVSPEGLGNVVAVSRSNEDGTSACSRLVDLPHFETLRDSKQLDHLVSTGWIERAM